ncbi:MAG: CdaR family protein, partial [Candidatus Binatia bacterium]
MKRLWEKLVLATTTNLGLKLLSLIIAFALWFFVNAGQKPAEKSVEVPVQFRNIPSELMVTNPALEQIEVRVMGPPAVLSTIESEQLKVVLDLDGARPGTSTFRLTPDFFRTPRGVRITHISPSIINLRLEAVAVRSVPVKVRLGEKLPFGYKIAALETRPETVRVRGPAAEVNRMSSVETLPFELEGVRGKITREARLDSGGKEVSFFPDRVTVAVILEEEW